MNNSIKMRIPRFDMVKVLSSTAMLMEYFSVQRSRCHLKMVGCLINLGSLGYQLIYLRALGRWGHYLGKIYIDFRYIPPIIMPMLSQKGQLEWFGAKMHLFKRVIDMQCIA